MPACFICDKHQTLAPELRIDFEGFEEFVVAHAPDRTPDETNHIGPLIIEPRSHIKSWAELPEDQAARLGVLIGKANALLMRQESIEHVYTWVYGDAIPHLHVWLIPRYLGTPREYWGAKVTQWPDTPKGGVKDMSAFIQKLQL